MTFPLPSADGVCRTDVLFTPPPGGDKMVCLKAGLCNAPNCAGVQGEQRCFIVNSASKDNCDPNPCHNGACLHQPQQTPAYKCVCPPSTSGDTCQHANLCNNKPCLHDGFCVDDSTSYHCDCRIGYSGHNCGTEVTQTTNPELTDPTMANGATVQCRLEETCTIPIYTLGTSGSQQLVEWPKTSGVDVALTQPVPDQNGPHMYRGIVKVTPKTTGDKKVCVKTTSVSPNRNQVICYNIEVPSSGTPSSETDMFVSPTPKSGTRIPCSPGKTCHLLMYSKPASKNTCPQVTGGDHTGIESHIFPTKSESGSCVTDVTITPDTSSGTHHLCVKARLEEPPRCFTIDTDKTDPCKNKDCGHGACIVDENHSGSCVCDGTHTGETCTEPAPCKSSPCLNHGVCEESGSDFTCHCPIGYTGTICDSSTDIPVNSKSKFSSSTLETGTTFNCIKDEVCKIPLSITKPSGPSPVMKVGPHSDDLHVLIPEKPSKDTDTPGRSDLYKGQVEVTPTETGDKKVCVKTGSSETSAGSQLGEIVCYHIHVTGTVPAVTDSFQDPTPASGSTVRCSPGRDCHVIVHSKPLENRTCPQVMVSSGEANVFPSAKDITFTDCITDISLPDEKLTSSSELCLKARPDEQERCFHFDPKPATDSCDHTVCDSVHGACILERNNTATCVCDQSITDVKCNIPNKCHNGGTTDSNGDCQCPLGYTSSNCELGTGGNEGSTTKFADNNMRNGGIIKCELEKPCTFPVYTETPTSSNTPPTLAQGPTSPLVDVHVDPSTSLTNSTGVPGLYTTPVTVTPHENGPNKICLKITDALTESVCYNIDVTSGGPTTTTNPGSTFTKPTLPDGSTMLCQSDVCHLLVHTEPDPSTHMCDHVQSQGYVGKTFKPKTNNGDCLTDVIYKPDSTPKELCIQAGSSGEKRCYKVMKTTKDPCSGVNCNTHGSCLREKLTDTTECVCEDGYTGTTCDTAVVQSLGIDDKKPHILEPTVTSGSLIQCEVNKPCKIPIVASPGSSGSTLEKPYVDGSSTGSTIPLKDNNGNFHTDVIFPTNTSGVKKHCVLLKTSSGVMSEQWCVLVSTKKPALTPNTDNFSSPTLPDGSVISCTVATTCTLPITTLYGHTLKDPTGITVPHVVEKDPNLPNTSKIRLTPTDNNIGDNNVCVQTVDGSSKRCYIVRVQQNPDALAKSGTNEGKSTGGTPGSAGGATVSNHPHGPLQPKVIGPTPLNGTTIKCDLLGCDFKLLVQTPSSLPGSIESVDKSSGSGSGTVSMTTHVTKSPNLHSIGVKLTPDPHGPDHQTICMKVKMSGTASSPWCVDVNIDKSGTATNPSSSSGEIVEPMIVPCRLGSTCLIPVTTPISTPLLSPLDNQASVQGTTTSSNKDTVTHTVAVTPSTSQPPLQKICLKQMTSATDTTTNVKRCLQVEVLSEVKPKTTNPQPTEPPLVAAQGLGIDTKEPHVLQPTMTSGTTMPCHLTCHMDVLVDPGTNPDGGVELIPTKGSPITVPEVVPTTDGKYKIKVEIKPNTTQAGLQPICFKVRNKQTRTEGNEWCINVNPTPDPSTITPAPGSTQTKDIVSSSLPGNTVLACTVDTTCSVDIKTIPGGGPPHLTGAQTLPASVSTDQTDPHHHTLSVTPSQSQVGNHQVCVTTVHDDKLCYKVKVTPNPTIPDGTQSTVPLTTIAPGKGAPTDFIPPENIDITKPRVIEPSSSPGSTIQCSAGQPCNIPLVVDTGTSGGTISSVAVNKLSAHNTAPTDLTGNKYKTMVTVPTTGMKPGVNPSCITIKTSSNTESRAYCVYVNYDPHPTTTVMPDKGLDTDHSLQEGSIIQCTIGSTCSVPFTEKATDPVMSVDTPLPNSIQTSSGSNPHEKDVLIKPTVTDAGFNKLCIKTESGTTTCYMIHVKTEIGTSGTGTSGTNPGKSGTKPGTSGTNTGTSGPHGGRDGGTSGSSCSNAGSSQLAGMKPAILGPQDSAKIECQRTGCKVPLIVELHSGTIDKVLLTPDSSGRVATTQTFPYAPHKYIVQLHLTPDNGNDNQKMCLKVISTCSISDPLCVEIQQPPAITGSQPQTSNTIVEPVQMKCHVGSFCHLAITTSTLRPFLKPTEPAGPVSVMGEILSPDMSGMLHEVVIKPERPGIHVYCLDAMKTPFDSSSTERHCVTAEVVPTVSDKQCSSSKTTSKKEAIGAYSSGRMTCQCQDGTTQTSTVMRPPASNGKLLRVAGLGFGGGVGTLAVAALIYLAVTKFQSKSRDRDRSNNDLYDMGFN